MSDREYFEKLPHILCLMQYVTCFDGLKYVSDSQYVANYLNGAWDTYQVRQAEVDKRLSELRAELAKHEPLDLEPADIPHGTIVIDK